MKTIWKYETPCESIFYITMPKDAEILCFQIDNKTYTPCIWAMVDNENRLEERTFELFGTGVFMPTEIGKIRKYIGTYQNGAFVWHLFERL